MLKRHNMIDSLLAKAVITFLRDFHPADQFVVGFPGIIIFGFHIQTASTNSNQSLI